MKERKTKRANLENKRKIFLEIGFIIALSAVLIAFEWKSFDEIIYTPLYESNYTQEEFMSIELRKEKITPVKPQSFAVLNIVENDVADLDDIEIDADIDEGDDMGDWVPIIEDESPIEEHIPYYSVQQKPEFPGGIPTLLKFVAQNYNIPKSDLEQGISGTIYVGFVVDTEGFVTNIEILRSISPASDIEAIRVANMIPRWKPGKQSTQKVAVKFNMPIKVSLQ